MDKFIDKFNIFDLFTMLIPGIIISTLFSVSLSFKFYKIWQNWGNEKYILFFILSYFCGVIFQEFGTIADKKIYKIYYGGTFREIFLLDNKYKIILNDELLFKIALKLKDYIVSIMEIEINNNENWNVEQQQEFNSFIFGYCLNMAEYYNLAGKSEKMIVISEMSRSLFWGCLFTIFLDFGMIFVCSSYYIFYVVEVIFLIIASYIFWIRKVRYEKFRIRIILRSLWLYIKNAYKPISSE